MGAKDAGQRAAETASSRLRAATLESHEHMNKHASASPALHPNESTCTMHVHAALKIVC